MRLCAIIASFVAASIGAAQAQSPPQRIASINMCTDQFLLSMAEPSQIAGLSPYARDGARSWLAHEAAKYPVLSGLAEDVLTLNPDLVVAGSFTKRATRELLRAKSVRVEEFDVANTIADAKAQIIRFGALVGRPGAAAAQVAAIDAALTRVREAAAKSSATVLALQRRGWVSGEASLMTSLLQAVGLRNAAATAGIAFGKLMTIEEIVVMRPDFLLVTRDDDWAEDQGRAMLLHPAIASHYPRERLIVLPEKLTVCGGVMLVEALDSLTRQIAGFERR